MRRFSLKFQAGLAVFAAWLILLGILASSPLWAAQQHRSYLRIADNGGQSQRIELGLNKSMIVELPREAREVMVPNPDKIDAILQTSTRAYLIGKAVGEANVLFLDKNGRQVASLDITIARDLSGLSVLLTRLLPGSNITVETVGERTVLTGNVTNPVDAPRACEIVTSYLGPLDQEQGGSSSATGGGSAITLNTTTNASSGDGGGGGGGSKACDPSNVINLLTVEGREQVLLKVSVVEMERNVLKQFGVDLNALINSGSFGFAALSDLPFPINVAGKGLLAPFLKGTENGATNAFPIVGAPNLPLVERTSGVGAQWQSGGSRVQGVLRALEEDGLLHTLAEPNLTAISGETANFLAGGEFPIPIAQQLGTISVEFKKFGIGLAFTPVVMSEGRISLKVSTEVSELSNQGAVILSNISIPALKVRRAETTVELPSGGSLVMAGLLSDQSKQALSGYPGLKNLPVLGTLFRSRDFLKNETELVVLVTPYVVKPVARAELAQPDNGFGWASDVSTDLMGQMNRVYGRHPERAPVGRFDGDVGFIVE